MSPGWWFGTFFIFPYIGNNHPNRIIFFRGVETTNQSQIAIECRVHLPRLYLAPPGEARTSQLHGGPQAEWGLVVTSGYPSHMNGSLYIYIHIIFYSIYVEFGIWHMGMTTIFYHIISLIVMFVFFWFWMWKLGYLAQRWPVPMAFGPSWNTRVSNLLQTNEGKLWQHLNMNTMDHHGAKLEKKGYCEEFFVKISTGCDDWYHHVSYIHCCNSTIHR
jgi:hypothetical protein